MDDDQRVRAAAELLAGMVGEWDGVARTWFEPDALADESPIRGTIRAVGDSRFLIHEYQSSFQERPVGGAAIYGYNQYTHEFESAWVDSFHMSTNIMVATGQPGEREPNLLGAYEVPDGPPWGWRTALRLEGRDQLILTSYNITPDGEESRAVEIFYNRRG